VALVGALLSVGSCAHSAAKSEPATREKCAELARERQRALERYEAAQRACDVYSRETFNWHDCIVAQG
jgi:hypothetical protein